MVSSGFIIIETVGQLPDSVAIGAAFFVIFEHSTVKYSKVQYSAYRIVQYRR